MGDISCRAGLTTGRSCCRASPSQPRSRDRCCRRRAAGLVSRRDVRRTSVRCRLLQRRLGGHALHQVSRQMSSRVSLHCRQHHILRTIVSTSGTCCSCCCPPHTDMARACMICMMCMICTNVCDSDVWEQGALARRAGASARRVPRGARQAVQNGQGTDALGCYVLLLT